MASLNRIEVPLGNLSKQELAELIVSRDLPANEIVRQIIKSEMLTVSPVRKDITLACLTLIDLGVNESIREPAIRNLAKKKGLELCPAEAALVFTRDVSLDYFDP